MADNAYKYLCSILWFGGAGDTPFGTCPFLIQIHTALPVSSHVFSFSFQPVDTTFRPLT